MIQTLINGYVPDIYQYIAGVSLPLSRDFGFRDTGSTRESRGKIATLLNKCNVFSQFTKNIGKIITILK